MNTHTSAYDDVTRNARAYLIRNRHVSDVRALALGLADFLTQQYDEPEDPVFYCPRCGMGGADHTGEPFDCKALAEAHRLAEEQLFTIAKKHSTPEEVRE